MINKFLEQKVVPGHPVGRAFLGAMIQYSLSKIWVTSLLNARINDVETIQFGKLEEIEKFADQTAGSVFRMILECVYSAVNDEKVMSSEVKGLAEHCASHLGRAVGIVTLLRASSYHLSNRKCYFPVELLTKVEITSFKPIVCDEYHHQIELIMSNSITSPRKTSSG
jgi:NADH dehydrogenase [ubiquinone] 1 alpha subcomplex assembly factor 6